MDLKATFNTKDNPNLEVTAKSKEEPPPTGPVLKAYGPENVFDRAFFVSLWLLSELSLIYFFTTILIFSGLYQTVWTIQTVGLLAIMHFVAIPAGYIGIRRDLRWLTLLSLLLCCVWLILIIVYAALFATTNSVKQEFNNRSLHHLALIAYGLIDLTVIILLSINIINENKVLEKSLRSVGQPPPTATPVRPTPPVQPPVAAKKPTPPQVAAK